MKQCLFFAVEDDLLPVFDQVEHVISLKYIRAEIVDHANYDGKTSRVPHSLRCSRLRPAWHAV